MMIPEGNLCYLATPYTKFPRGIEHAFVEAAQIAAKLLQAGHAVYSPIVHCHPISRYGDLDPLDHSIWLPFNEAMLIATDVLIVARMEGWRESYGVGVEIKHFEESRKPIFDLEPRTMRMTKRPLLRADQIDPVPALAHNKKPREHSGPSA